MQRLVVRDVDGMHLERLFHRQLEPLRPHSHGSPTGGVELGQLVVGLAPVGIEPSEHHAAALDHGMASQSQARGLGALAPALPLRIEAQPVQRTTNAIAFHGTALAQVRAHVRAVSIGHYPCALDGPKHDAR